MTIRQTPSQTIGPFFAYGLTPEQYDYQILKSIASNIMVSSDTQDNQITIEGKIFDGDNKVVPDAIIEIWQASSSGDYIDPNHANDSNSGFTGFGRCGTGVDPENKFIFHTIKPGMTKDNQAPHVNLIIFMRGLLLHTYTRMYFPEEELANSEDYVLSIVPKERRHTLIAKPFSSHEENRYVFDIYMQGKNETIFFDV